MANQILKKYIGNKQIDADKILLDNNTALKSKDLTGLLEKDIIKLDGSDKVVITDLKNPLSDFDAAHKKYVDDQVAGGGQALSDHINDPTSAHMASSIEVVPNGNLISENVQSALQELQGDLDNISASSVPFSSYGNIAATDVQAALQELDDEKVAKAGDTMSGALTVQDNNFLPDVSKSSLLSGGSLGVSTEEITADNLLYANYDSGSLTIAKETLNNPVYQQFYSMSYQNGKLSLIEGASDPMTPTAPEHASTKKYVDDADGVLQGYIDNINNSIGSADGIAPLNSSTKIDAIYLPSYVDDVVEYANLAAFPVSGESSKIYVALDSNKTYRWSGSTYVEVSPSEVNSVNGLFGIVTLDSSHISENDPNNRWYTPARQSSMEAYADQAEADAKSYADGIVATEQTARENEDLTFVKLDGSRAMTGDLDMDAHKAFDVSRIEGVTTTSEYLTIKGAATGGGVWVTADPTETDGLWIDRTGYGYVQQSQEFNVTAPSINITNGNPSTEAALLITGNKLTVSAGALNGLSMGNHIISDLADPVNAQDAVTKKYLEDVTPVCEIFKKTLDATDITNGYIDLPHLATRTNGMGVFADRLALHQGASEDYTLTVSGGVTRITFLNDMIGVGSQKLASGDNIYVRYEKLPV